VAVGKIAITGMREWGGKIMATVWAVLNDGVDMIAQRNVTIKRINPWQH